MRRILFILSLFVAMTALSSTGHALFGSTPKCPKKWKDVSDASVDSARYKGHCGLVLCTNGGQSGLGNCESLQREVYAKRIRKNCRPVPPTSQCLR